jgi:hypothetical protein
MGRVEFCQKGHKRTVIGDRVSDGISEGGRGVVEVGTLEQGIKEEIECKQSKNREEGQEVKRGKVERVKRVQSLERVR